MDPAFVSAIVQAADGKKVNVADFCATHSISRTTFYKYVARFKAEGADGFTRRSTAPHTSPTRASAVLCEAVVRACKELADEGLDNGPQSISWRLETLGLEPFPSRATAYRILLQRLLDRYRSVYNNRRHQSLAGKTPQQRYDEKPTVTATPEPKIRHGQVSRSISHTGIVEFDGHSISLGRAWVDRKAVLHWRGDDVTVMVSDVVARNLTLDRSIRFQPLTALSTKS